MAAQPGASDRLTVTDEGLGDTTIHRIGGIAGNGSVPGRRTRRRSSIPTSSSPASIRSIRSPAARARDGLGTLFVFKHDPFEENNSRLNATFLGSNSAINVDPTIDPGADALFGLPGDEDWYRIVPQFNGDLDIRVFFRQQGTAGQRPRRACRATATSTSPCTTPTACRSRSRARACLAPTTPPTTSGSAFRPSQARPITCGSRARRWRTSTRRDQHLQRLGHQHAGASADRPGAGRCDRCRHGRCGRPRQPPTQFDATAARAAVRALDGERLLQRQGHRLHQRQPERHPWPDPRLHRGTQTVRVCRRHLLRGPDGRQQLPDRKPRHGPLATRQHHPRHDADDLPPRAERDECWRRGDAGRRALQRLCPRHSAGPVHRHSLQYQPDGQTATAPGFRVPIFVTEHGTSDQGPPNNVLAGYAQPVDPVNRPGLFSFTFGSPGSLITELPVFPGTSETTASSSRPASR